MELNLRHLGGGIGDDVRDDPHARLGRIDIGVADHELLEDVVLDGPREQLALDPLLLAGDDEGGQHRDHRAVHGHRHRDPVERNAVEEDLHVLDGIDRDPGLADIALHPRMVAVVAAVGGEIEGDADPLLPRRQRLAVEGVALLRRRKAGVLPDRPGPAGIHRRPRPAREGRETGQAVEMVEARQIRRRIERAHRDPLRRRPGQAFGRPHSSARAPPAPARPPDPPCPSFRSSC